MMEKAGEKTHTSQDARLKNSETNEKERKNSSRLPQGWY